MNNELLAMLEYIEQERGISKEQVVKALEQAILSAYRKSAHPASDLNVTVNLRTGELKAWARLKVVEEFPTDDEILLANALRRIPGAKVGDRAEFGGLLGSAPVMAVHPESAEEFISRGGRIPAPIHSLRN